MNQPTLEDVDTAIEKYLYLRKIQPANTPLAVCCALEDFISDLRAVRVVIAQSPHPPRPPRSTTDLNGRCNGRSE